MTDPTYNAESHHTPESRERDARLVGHEVKPVPVDAETVTALCYKVIGHVYDGKPLWEADFGGIIDTLRALLAERDALKAEVEKLREENERLRGLVFAAYCEGWIEAGGGVLVDNKWAQSECHAALKGEQP